MKNIEQLLQAAHTWYALDNSEFTSVEKLDLIAVLTGEYYAKWAYCSNIHPNYFDEVWTYKDAYSKLDYRKEYLVTWYWQYIRKLVIGEHGNQCEICGAEPSVEVHHKTYAHIGEEYLFLDDLLVLCRSCHAKAHNG